MSGHFNAAAEERKPLMISFDDDDNLVDTTIGSITIVANGFDGGEEIRLEYPGIGTEFYAFDEASETGWRRGRTAEDTARSITNVINRHYLILNTKTTRIAYSTSFTTLNLKQVLKVCTNR